MNLLLRALGPHLRHLAPGSPLRCVGRRLRLLGLLLALRGRLLFLAFPDGSLARCGPGLGTLRSALLNHVERGTDDSTLLLDGAAGAFLSDFLFRDNGD